MCTIYLLHFSRPISPHHTCQHYLGSTDDLGKRLYEHAHGTGSRLCEVAKARGISFTLAAVWEGDRQLERKLKRWHNGKKLCPYCNGTIPPSRDVEF